MQVESVAETLSFDDGVVQIALDLSGSELGYLVISLPTASARADEFFGHDHYVEVKDQLFGRYGGLSGLEILGNHVLRVHLAEAVPGIGDRFTITTRTALTEPLLSQLRRLPGC